MKIVLTAALFLSFATVASAQPKKGEPAAKAPHVKVINMGAGEDIDGDVPTGELMPINAREAIKSTSLLRIRRDFIDMILKAAEDLS